METLPLPKSISVVATSRDHGVFTIEPLYPGYGMTVGNALRRVLLSSMPGAAITAVKIDGVDHDFSTINYVKEDVVDILLNLKLVRLKLNSDEPVTLTLEAKGETAVTAGMITPNSQVEIANPDQVIATLTDAAAKISMELTVAKGRGYVPVENREKEKLPIGTIALDAIYTPMKNVNFSIEHVRVEQITNFDKLILDITTDGTITPTEALTLASSIMVEHFQFVHSWAVTPEATPAEMSQPAVSEKPKKKATRKKKTDTGETDESSAT